MDAKFDYSCRGILGPESKDMKEIVILNRELRVVANVSPFEVELEADRRHVDILIDQFGLSNAKGVSTPGVSPTVVELESP